MALKSEEVESIKSSLLGQLDNFPEDKRSVVEDQIKGMSDEQVEEFVKQNNLTHMPGGCVFCSIVEGKSQSVKIDESDLALAILEINPLSKGHALVVPKKHVEKISIQVKDFAEALAKRMKKILSVKEVTVREIKIMDHSLIEVIPLYGTETERYQATQEELLEMQKVLTGQAESGSMIKDDSRAEEIVEDVSASSRTPSTVDGQRGQKEEARKELRKFAERIPRFS